MAGLGSSPNADARPRPQAPAAAPTVSKARQAEDKASQAKEAFGRGAFTEALDLYRQALALDPGRVVFAYGIAISAENQGDLDTARTAYQQFLQLAPAAHPLVAEAREALARLKAPPAPPVAAPPAPPPTVRREDPPLPVVPPANREAPKPVAPRVAEHPSVVENAPPPAPARWPARITLGLAGAFAITGAAFAISAAVTDADADQYRLDGTRTFDPARISESGARERLGVISSRWTYAAVFGGCAVASGAIGTWLHLRKMQVATDGKSLTVAWDF